MKYDLPDILRVGTFDSRRHLSSLAKTTPRTVQKYELEYYFEDGGAVVLNDVKNKIKRGTMLLAKPGDIRYSYLPFRCRFLHFAVTDKNLIKELEKIEPFFYISDGKLVEDALDSISKYFYSNNALEKILTFAELITLLHTISNENAKLSKPISQAKKFIKNNAHRSISTKDIADACYLSESYLHKIFKTELDITPGEYLVNCRISSARNLLVNTDLSLTEISDKCGFNSQSYFSYCFKKHTGVSPKDFRKSYFL